MKKMYKKPISNVQDVHPDTAVLLLDSSSAPETSAPERRPASGDPY